MYQNSLTTEYTARRSRNQNGEPLNTEDTGLVWRREKKTTERTEHTETKLVPYLKRFHHREHQGHGETKKQGVLSLLPFLDNEARKKELRKKLKKC